ncbi:MAG: hypothetical protein KC589_06915 [Nanoarchaeota archaeon]|nr:hypothetical protein [Nanoarchaeota archaeon]
MKLYTLNLNKERLIKLIPNNFKRDSILTILKGLYSSLFDYIKESEKLSNEKVKYIQIIDEENELNITINVCKLKKIKDYH